MRAQNCLGAHRRAQKVVAAPEISGRSAILSRVAPGPPGPLVLHNFHIIISYLVSRSPPFIIIHIFHISEYFRGVIRFSLVGLVKTWGCRLKDKAKITSNTFMLFYFSG